jgi:hypothetical protein
MMVLGASIKLANFMLQKIEVDEATDLVPIWLQQSTTGSWKLRIRGAIMNISALFSKCNSQYYWWIIVFPGVPTLIMLQNYSNESQL